MKNKPFVTKVTLLLVFLAPLLIVMSGCFFPVDGNKSDLLITGALILMLTLYQVESGITGKFRKIALALLVTLITVFVMLLLIHMKITKM